MTTRNGLPDPVGLLPAPPVPLMPRSLPDPAIVAAYAGDGLAAPLVRIVDAHAVADAAVAALQAARPGGRRYLDDLDLDVADRVGGETAKTSRVARLVDGDRQRWAEATIACRAAVAVSRVASAQLDK